MKIAFICGCLEPGKDGVGDYTTRLATELSRTGYEVSLIAINDHHLSVVYDDDKYRPKVETRMLRIPSSWSRSQRFSKAREWIDFINPEWISLQFVPFSFHRKGLPFSLRNDLSTLGAGRQWHVMFHELWVGMPTTASRKHMIWGWMQKGIIRSLLTKLKPKITQTQCTLYYSQLKLMGVDVSHLPLFSNIPPVVTIRKIQELNDPKTPGATTDALKISIVLFGTIHPQASVDRLLMELVRYRRQHNSTFTLMLVGNTGSQTSSWVTQFEEAGIPVFVHGEQDAAQISALFDKANFGISTSALATIEKSGSVAAMLEHALPVLCVGDYWKPRNLNSPCLPPGIHTLREGCIAEVLNITFKAASFHSVSTIAKTFVEALQKSS